MTATEAPAAGEQRTQVAALIARTLLTIPALLQGLMFALTGQTVHRAIGLLLAAASVALFLRASLPAKHRIGGLWVLAIVIAVNIAMHLAQAQAPFPYRFLQAVVTMWYGCLVVAAVVRLVFRGSSANVLLTATVSLVVMAIVDGVGMQVPALTLRAGGVRWVGGTSQHPVIGDYYAPNTRAKIYYPDNPRGYFTTTDTVGTKWNLDAHDPGSAGTVTNATSTSRYVHIGIDRARSGVPWHLQLNQAGFALKPGERYTLTFRIRAARERPVSIGVSMAHAPWDGLGFYQTITADTAWAPRSYSMVSVAGDSNARIHFDLGGSDAAVDVADVRLSRVDGTPVRSRMPDPEYFVDVKFNALGCRGPDRAIPRPPGTTRIVSLGDSYTLGVGVHEQDTFSAVLERELNSAYPDRGHEIINCGVSGHATKQERQVFELIDYRYEPQIVLLTMVFNDDISWQEEVQRGYFHQRGKFEQLLFLDVMLQLALHEARKPKPDFTANVKEIIALDRFCRARNARLVVTVFRNGPQVFDQMVKTVSAGLQGTDIPFIDMGDALLSRHDPVSLMVHEHVDGHPNEIAHRIAADTLLTFLRTRGIVPGQ